MSWISDKFGGRVRSKVFSTLKLVFFILAFAPGYAHAATITVSSMSDGASSSVNCTLRDAISSVNNGADWYGCVAAGGYGTSDTINVPTGTYTITGTADNANVTGDLDITKSVTIIGAGSASTIIDGAGAERVFAIDPAWAGGIVATISNVTISNGFQTGLGRGAGISNAGTLSLSDSVVSGCQAFNAAGIDNNGTITILRTTIDNNSTTGNSGGGMINGGTATITDSFFTNNFLTGANRLGGAIAIFGTGVQTTITGTTISGNTATGEGGGIYQGSGANVLTISNSSIGPNIAGSNGGGVYNAGTLTLTNTAISGNTAGAKGGGIYDTADSGAVTTISGSTISNNIAGTDGGGIWKTSSFGATVNITNSIIDNNQANSWGGGIALWGGNTTTVTSSIISNNTSGGQGGGIFNTSSLTVSDSTFSGNNSSSNHGGGIYTSGAFMIATITNSTFSSNNAQWSGGGIHQSSGNVSITNSTFSGNTANTSGGGIFSTAGTTTITNVTLTANTAPTGGGIFNSGSTVNLSNTLIANQASGGDCSGGISTTVNDLDSDGSCGVATTADPLLGGLANNGGTTMTHALLIGSPAIDAGTCVNANDQIGTIRPQDGDGDGVADCDIGAFEFPLVVSGCTDPTASNYAPTAIIDDGSCIYAGITITIKATDGRGGQTTKTLKLTPQ